MTDKKITFKLSSIIGIIAAMLFITFIVAGRGKNLANNNGEFGKLIVENVQNSPELALAIDNSESSPMLIQTASAQEIINEKYQLLTGLYPKSSKYITVPNVTAINNTDRIVTAIVLVLTDKRSNEHDGLFITDLRIEPSGNLSVQPVEWAKPRKNMMKKYIATDGEVKEDTSDPDLSSEAMWLAGSISDFSISIGMVEFADGGKWMTNR